MISYLCSTLAVRLSCIVSGDGKKPSLLGFGSVRVLTKVRVRFGSSYSQVQKIGVRFGFGSFSVLSSVRFYKSLAV